MKSALDLSAKTSSKQGAESKLYTGDFLGKSAVFKERFPKKYRHPDLDELLSKERTRSEARALLRCRSIGIHVPAVYMVDLQSRLIVLENIQDSVTIKDFIFSCQKTSDGHHKIKPVVEETGKVLAQLHKNGIIHGDLTTSNILIKGAHGSGVIYLIDFGLSYISDSFEDKGVDLYVLERAFLSTHPNTEELFQCLMNSYSKHYGKKHVEVVKKLDEVRMRGRKRTMVG